MTNNKKTVGKLLNQRDNFIVIGLTGRTGSGCTTAANILSKEFSPPQVSDINNTKDYKLSPLSKKRYEITRKFTENNWQKFYSIKISDIITSILFETNKEDLVSLISNTLEKNNSKAEEFLNKFNFNGKLKILSRQRNLIDAILSGIKTTDIEEDEIQSLFIRYQLYSRELKSSIDKFYGSGSYVKLYQKMGNLIRHHGKIENRGEIEKNIENIYRLPEIINRIIKLLRRTHKKKEKATLIVIDAIRNPYEAKYFKDRYAAFYLVSINTNNDDRVKYLGATRKFTPDEVKTIDIIESAKLIDEHGETSEPNKNEKLYMQNVPACLEISDIHLYNPRVEPENNNALRAQLTWYLSLMKHPGLITPTSNERVMQFAFSAKVNSGCISRQVGAAVTDIHNSIRSIGWNDVAEGQTPCNLRSLDGLMSSYDPKEYSKYEREDHKFRKIAVKQLDALNNTKETNLSFSYCFKSFQNIKEKEKNQVHTRSLHAEENAFLQIAKSGGAGIKNGKLFTTASPCELCAKKAYQLGIKEIVYIDPYPGIAIDHIINIGETPPVTTQFVGAVGSAYHRLYEPLMPFKDQLELLKSD